MRCGSIMTFISRAEICITYKRSELTVININILYCISNCIFYFNVSIVTIYCNDITIISLVYNYVVVNFKRIFFL